MESPAISIIVDACHYQNPLDNCVRSIQNQTFQDFEVLICGEASVEDERFSCISDINTAIRQAKGEYLAFVNGNDRIKKDFLENLHDAVNDTDSDIAVCGYCYYFPRKRRRGKIKPTIFQPSDNKTFARGQALYILLPDRPVRFFLWNKLWKRQLFVDHDITVPDMYYEDVITCTKLFYYAKKVITLEDGSYLYTQPDQRYHKKNVTPAMMNDYLKTVALIRAFLEENNCYEIYKKPFLAHARHVSLSVPLMLLRASKRCENSFSVNRKAAKNFLKTCLSCTKEELLHTDLHQEIVK